MLERITSLDPTTLIGGPYRPPRVTVGSVATCLYRDAEVVISSVSNARIPWPRCRRRDGGGAGSGLLVDETLVRAIRTESAAAITHWFGVTGSTVWMWRKAFGVGMWDTPGSRRLLESNTQKANAATRGKPLSQKVVRERRRRAITMDLARHLRAYHARQPAKPVWREEELSLLGTMPDVRLAVRLGRTRDEVRQERVRRFIPRYRKLPHPEAHLSADERERLRRERIAAAKRGKPRPAHVIEAMREGRQRQNQG